jgi:hypothetical protein
VIYKGEIFKGTGAVVRESLKRLDVIRNAIGGCFRELVEFGHVL